MLPVRLLVPTAMRSAYPHAHTRLVQTLLANMGKRCVCMCVRACVCVFVVSGPCKQVNFEITDVETKQKVGHFKRVRQTLACTERERDHMSIVYVYVCVCVCVRALSPSIYMIWSSVHQIVPCNLLKFLFTDADNYQSAHTPLSPPPDTDTHTDGERDTWAGGLCVCLGSSLAASRTPSGSPSSSRRRFLPTSDTSPLTVRTASIPSAPEHT